jgi:hypothetical protein
MYQLSRGMSEYTMADGRRDSRFLWNIYLRAPNKVSYHKMATFVYAEDWDSRYP